MKDVKKCDCCGNVLPKDYLNIKWHIFQPALKFCNTKCCSNYEQKKKQPIVGGNKKNHT